MGRTAAAGGSAAFFVLAPGVVAGVVPWWLTRWRIQDPLPYWAPLRLLGAVLVVIGMGVLLGAFVQFVAEGIGSPAPVAPTEQLVVGGLYRYVRNPMYLAVLSTIAGQALLLGQLALLLYGCAVAVAFVAFVRGYEEPVLRRRYGAAYDDYLRDVPGWWPRRAGPHPDPPPQAGEGNFGDRG
jgi:protein-S-isoprenylcysteine O-methyltransferase Ste14